MGNNLSGKETCDDCPAQWDYKCKANVHFHCSQHYFERLKLGTLPHGGPEFWDGRSTGAVKLEPVADFRRDAGDSKVKMARDVPAPIRSAVLKSTSAQHLKHRLQKAGIVADASVDKSQVQKAHDIIPKLRAAIISGSEAQVHSLSNELMAVMPPQVSVTKVLSEEELLKQIDILEMLDDVVANQELEDYDALLQHCEVQAVEMDSPEAQLIHQYMRQNMSNMTVIGAEVFRVARKEEQAHPRSNNQVLLWHGSKTGSFVSILRNGLRLPKNASHGWLFGPGIYFADLTSKSLSYCGDLNDCLIALAEVNLGSMYPAFDYVEKPPKGYDSVWAVGKQWPCPATFVPGCSEHAVLPGCDIPMGRPCNVKFSSGNPCRNVNEFIVYETARVRLRYLIRARVQQGGSNPTDTALSSTRRIKASETYLDFMKDLGATKVMVWQFWLAHRQDGMAPGWHPYDAHLHKELEQRFADGEETVDVRSGKHGFTYRVDFKAMRQTNLTHSDHTQRAIRRIDVDDAPAQSPEPECNVQ